MKDYKSGSLTSRFIDSLAIIATLFGTAASLGLGALQISRGFQIVAGWQVALTTLALIVIGILTLKTIASAVSGVARGIKWLSNVNLALAIGLALFIFLVGPTIFLLNIIPGVLIDYFASSPAFSARTMSDSASLVNSQLAQQGNPQPRRLVTAFFALLMAGIAVVMLMMGGRTALSGLQNLITVTALPFSVILIVMVIALWKDLRSDPLVLRGPYETWAVEKAVRRGIDEHGDNFTLAIEPTNEETYDYGAGSHFDSEAEPRSGD